MSYSAEGNSIISSMASSASNLGSIIAKIKPPKKRVSPTTSFPNIMPQTQNNTANSTPMFKSPVDLSKLGSITTKFGGSTKFEGSHPGVDIANKIGTPLPSFTGGRVVRVDSGYKQGDKGFGNSVIIQDAQGNRYRYSHLNKSYVKVGDVVQRGQVFGEMGNTGSTYSNSGGTGSHLDLRIKDAYGKLRDPLSFLKNVNS